MNNLVLASQLVESASPVSTAYLSFQINDGLWAALPMDDVHEVLSVSPQQITPVFNMPPCVLGLLTRRSRILWTVDLSHLLLSSPLIPQRTLSAHRHAVIVTRVSPAEIDFIRATETSRFNASEVKSSDSTSVRSRGSTEEPVLFGLVVREVKGTVSINTASIQSPQGHFSADFAPCLRGSVLQQDRLLHLLDANMIARSPVIKQFVKTSLSTV